MKAFNESPPAAGSRASFLAGVLAGLTLAAPGQEPPPPLPPTEGTLRAEVQVVNIYCTVKNKKGGLVTDLERGEFEIREDGKRQELRYFTRETDRPLTLALLVDTSVSQGQVLPVEKAAAAQFLRQILRPSDLALLMTFDVSVDMLQDFTTEADRLRRALDRARINSPQQPDVTPRRGPVGTRLYDAIYLAAREKLAPEAGRKAIVVVSDGVDAGSHVKDKEAIEAAHRSDTMIYAIGISDPGFYGGGFPGRGGNDALKNLAAETGGRAIFPSNPEELQRAFDQIASELRSQYSLGYTPSNRTHDGRFRRVEVKVKRPEAHVQARRGYYAPKS